MGKSVRFFLGGGILACMFLSFLATATVHISAGSESESNKRYIERWATETSALGPGKIYFTTELASANPGVEDIAAENCIKIIDGEFGRGKNRAALTNWGQTYTDPDRSHGTMGFKMTVANICTHDVEGRVIFKMDDPDWWFVPYYKKFPATAETCSVDINDIINLGQQESEKVVTINPVGAGLLSFKPDENDGQEGILSDQDGDRIPYSIKGTSWDGSQWNGTLGTYNIKLGDVSSANPGAYSGTMTVSISCE